jgi:hypothetical protein
MAGNRRLTRFPKEIVAIETYVVLMYWFATVAGFAVRVAASGIWQRK